MTTETFGPYEVKRQIDIDELIVTRYNQFNEFAIYDAEIGNDIGAINKHFQKLDLLLVEGKAPEALQERKNMNQTFWHVLNHNNFPALQWMSLVDTINGEPLEDRSPDTLKNWIVKLSEHGLTMARVKADVEAAKKKSVNN